MEDVKINFMTEKHFYKGKNSKLICKLKFFMSVLKRSPYDHSKTIRLNFIKILNKKRPNLKEGTGSEMWQSF